MSGAQTKHASPPLPAHPPFSDSMHIFSSWSHHLSLPLQSDRECADFILISNTIYFLCNYKLN